METKNKGPVVDIVKRRLQFKKKKTMVVNPLGIVGGLLVMWNKEVIVVVKSSSGTE